MSSPAYKNEFIAITGCGSVSPLGKDRQNIYTNYLSCESLLKIKTFNNKEYAVGSLSNSAEEALTKLMLDTPKYRKIDKSVLMAVYASYLAVLEAKWGNTQNKLTGVNIGSSRGTTGLFEQLHSDFLKNKLHETTIHTSPLTTLGYVSNEVAAYLNLTGPLINTAVTCSTALQAISNAVAWLKAGMADRFIAGGSEAPLTPFTLAQVEAIGICTKEVHSPYPCTPLIKKEPKENTFTLGEGAAAFALEKISLREIHEKMPLGIIESIGFSYERPPSPSGISANGLLISSSMKMALNNMITDNEIDLILLHAPGTVKGDEAELKAVQDVFGNNRPNLFSNKWKIGHTYAASAALNLELALICLQNNFNPAFPYPVTFRNAKKNIRKVMINATGFGGNSTTMIVSHPNLFI
jgi:3-oxoacyl-[acyl-carrier-protein] synthase II